MRIFMAGKMNPRSPVRNPQGARISQDHAASLLDLGVQAVEHAGERNGLAHVRQTAEPGDRPLDAQPEARVRERAVAAHVEVPLEGLARELVRLDGRLEPSEIVLALTAADHLAVSLGR